MKKSVRILLPILLAVAIVACMIWYLFVYDQAFTRDLLLSCARFSENRGNHTMATWFYNCAYNQADDNDAVAIELAEQYKRSGNYTKAEVTLSKAIADGGGIDVYIALSKTYVEQDKLLAAVNMLDSIANAQIKAELASMRPAAPTSQPEPGFYSQYISVTIEADSGTLYVSTDGTYPSMKDEPYSEPVLLSDGENTIYALAVSKNGLVSPVSIFGYTVGGVVTEMNFADAKIEAEVRKLLSVSDDKQLYTNDLWTLTEFTVPQGATNYADLRQMSFLTSLTIDNGVSDQLGNLSGLANLETLTITNTSVSQEHLGIISVLPQLKKLTLQGCSLSAVTPLNKAVNLTYLDLSNNTISSIDSLASCTALTELFLQNNVIASLSSIAGDTKLTKLDASHNSLTSLAPLSGLSSLTWLNASTNNIADLGSIGNLTELTYLNLSSNKLTDVSALASCVALTNLNLSTNSLTNISGLSALTNMMYFDFSYNQVSALPKFSTDCALVTITGTKNNLSSLDALSGLTHLNNVHMDYNENISSVNCLADCPVLIEVNVYGTKVSNASALKKMNVIVNYNPV